MIQFKDRVSLLALLLFLFVLPFSKAAVSISLVLLLMVGLFVAGGSGIKAAFQQPAVRISLAFVGWHIISLGWTDNLSFGLFDLQIKILIAVVVIAVQLQQTVLDGSRSLLMLILFLGLSAALLTQFVLAYYKYRLTGNLYSFSYQAFSRFMHPSYLACYLNAAVLLLLDERVKLPGPDKLLRWVFGVFFSLAVVLLNSKAGIIGWFLVTVGYHAWMAVSNRSLRPLLGMILFPLFLLLLIKITAPLSEDRMTAMFKSVGQGVSSEVTHESSSIRIDLWKTTVALIKEQPMLGTGVGDVKDVLVAGYADRGLFYAVERRYNSHNQFLQTFLAVGILGFFLLLLFFGWPLSNRKFLATPFPTLFLALAGFNLLVESMLEKQDGVVWFSLFYSLFLTQISSKKTA